MGVGSSPEMSKHFMKKSSMVGLSPNSSIQSPHFTGIVSG